MSNENTPVFRCAYLWPIKCVQNCIIYNYYLGQMQCFRTKISIPVTPLTHDVTSASKLCYSHFGRIQRPQNLF